MADIQHNAIQDPDIHEPKGAGSANSNEVYVANGAGSGVWTPTKDIQLPTGWEDYEDSTYTSTSPLALSAGVRTKVTIDGLGPSTNTTYSPVTAGLWDSTNNKITPENIGDMYDIRLRLKATPGATGGYVTFELDIGGTLGTILAQTQSYIKGVAEVNMLFVSTIFSLDTFVANGGSIYATSSVAADLYDIGLLINRTHKAS